MILETVVVRPSALERPLRHTAGVIVKPKPSCVPSIVECQGRTTSIAFSERLPSNALVGGDVAAPQRGSAITGAWQGYSAGGGNDGTSIGYPLKKVCGVREGPTYAIWLAGSNGSGGIYRRDDDDGLWDFTTAVYWGTSNDGGSSDPRRTGSRLVVIDGANVFVSCERAASPTNGVARSTDSGATWTAWSFGTSRNYTAMMKSPNWEYMLAASDGRVGSGQDGVWILRGLAGTVTVVQADTVGAGAPDLADVRAVYPVDENGDDCWFVVVGNAAGSDADRGIWRLRITVDPNDGGFNAATHMTWTQIYQGAATDRLQSVCAWKPNGAATGPVYVWGLNFASSTVATGTYTLSPGAGGSVNTFRQRVIRSFDGDATTPIWEVITNAENINMVTYGTNHEHVQTYVGEQSNEKSRLGGSSFQGQDMDISADGSTLILCGKSSPWICRNPGGGPAIFQPFSRGLGLLEGSYASVYVPDIGDGSHGFAVSDDDRGMYTFRSLNLSYKGPEWVVAENIDGATTTDNAMFGVSVDVGTPLTLLIPRRLNGRAYRVTNPFVYESAVIAAMTPDTSADPPAVGAFAWIDSLGADRRLIVTEDKIWRDTVTVETGLGTVAKRSEFIAQGVYCWLHIPDLGIYRSQDNGASWDLWWSHGIASTTTNRYAGHMTLIPPDTLLVTFETAGVWACADADTSAAGTGIGGSRPTGASLLSSGDLATTDFISAMDFDPVTGDIWGCGYDPTGTVRNSLYVRRASSATWVEIQDDEYAESAIIPQSLTAYDGLLIIGTASNGALIRMV